MDNRRRLSAVKTRDSSSHEALQKVSQFRVETRGHQWSLGSFFSARWRVPINSTLSISAKFRLPTRWKWDSIIAPGGWFAFNDKVILAIEARSLHSVPIGESEIIGGRFPAGPIFARESSFLDWNRGPGGSAERSAEVCLPHASVAQRFLRLGEPPPRWTTLHSWAISTNIGRRGEYTLEILSNIGDRR